jgi:hypothetical protein
MSSRRKKITPSTSQPKASKHFAELSPEMQQRLLEHAKNMNAIGSANARDGANASWKRSRSWCARAGRA